MSARFDSDALDAVGHDLVIGVRAGSGEHRFTPVWAVVVDGRVFIRSWGHAEHSWYHAFRDDPIGAVEIAGREFPVRAVHTRSERILDAVDDAYRRKYHTPASQRYVRDMTAQPSRETTTELVPVEK